MFHSCVACGASRPDGAKRWLTKRNKDGRNARRDRIVQRPVPQKARRRRAGIPQKMSPIIVKYPYQVNYVHSYGKTVLSLPGWPTRLLGCRDPETGYTMPTHAVTICYGKETEWVRLPDEEPFMPLRYATLAQRRLAQCPFGSSRRAGGRQFLVPEPVVGVDPNQASLDWIA